MSHVPSHLFIILAEKGAWKVPDTRRKFFENIAKQYNFDPLDLESWFFLSKQVKSAKVLFCIILLRILFIYLFSIYYVVGIEKCNILPRQQCSKGIGRVI
jgi:hypothetical protein